ncbi:MAG: YifB family Mg chelatase-like AAA ATPase [Nanoarchaeota archaeon]|nr:YifB family Mg chelatase-like AAA ATPase [Nanoarchaeota archaeon]
MRSVPKLLSADTHGISAHLVRVEADLGVGLHSFQIVGLADKAVSEAKERVSSALKHCGARPPSRDNHRITVNLAPADVKKSGSRFDLPIALAYLLASEQLSSFPLEDSIFLGELSLDGALRPVPGVLNVALLAREEKISTLYVPQENASEAALLPELRVFPVSSLSELIAHLEGREAIAPQPRTSFSPSFSPSAHPLSHVRGLRAAKRALLVAASGGHHLFLSGPPGTGKTMLAQTLSSLLPPPDLEEGIEITRIYSSVGLLGKNPIWTCRPFRNPHHSASFAALIGGGTDPRPGEISLAHRGVLFLDEAPEFRRDALEALRQPLEAGEVHVSRVKGTLSFPARFMLILAMNPCPCGYFGDVSQACQCTAREVFRYQKKISGPLLDRIDIQIEVPRTPLEELRDAHSDKTGANEDEIFREAVSRARKRQSDRFGAAGLAFRANAEMSSNATERFAKLHSSAEELLRRMLKGSFISTRGYYRILKIARTIADLDASDEVSADHLGEAFQYRLKESRI